MPLHSPHSSPPRHPSRRQPASLHPPAPTAPVPAQRARALPQSRRRPLRLIQWSRRMSSADLRRRACEFLRSSSGKPHSRKHLPHGYRRTRIRPKGSVVQNRIYFIRIRLEIVAPFLDRRQFTHHTIGQPALALNAPDPSRRAANPHLGLRLVRRKNLVQIEHRTYVRIPRISPPHTRRIGHHSLQLRAHVALRLRKQDRVPVALRHLPPIGPRSEEHTSELQSRQ